MAERERKHQLKIWVTEEEKNIILERRKVAGFRNTSAYIRKIAIDGRIFKIDHAPLKETSSLMTRISTNINQIAKRVNSTNNFIKKTLKNLRR